MPLAFLAPPRRLFAERDPLDEADEMARKIEPEETAYRRAFLAAVAAMLTLLDDADTENGVPATLISEMVRIFETVFAERGQGIVERAFTTGAQFAFNRLPRSATLGYTFDMVNPDAVLWAQLRAAEMVTGISDETMQAIRAVIVRSLQSGPAPRDVARLIRPMIGLTERDALAVGNLQTRLIGEGRSESAIARLVSRYANRLLRRRAENISRTEILTAANRGSEALWRRIAQDGLLLESEWERYWLIAKDERTCTVCRPLDRKRAPMGGGSYPGGFIGPPAHPSCRCAQALVRKSA